MTYGIACFVNPVTSITLAKASSRGPTKVRASRRCLPAGPDKSVCCKLLSPQQVSCFLTDIKGVVLFARIVCVSSSMMYSLPFLGEDFDTECKSVCCPILLGQ